MDAHSLPVQPDHRPTRGAPPDGDCGGAAPQMKSLEGIALFSLILLAAAAWAVWGRRA
jgi:hypothetical protein